MRIARPPEGFRINVQPKARLTLDEAAERAERLAEVWEGICERLKYTAHREGDLLPNGQLVMHFPGAARFDTPSVTVCYKVLGDAVTVHRVLVTVL